MVVRNKHGWIRLVEAFISILLIGMILVLIVNQQGTQKDSLSSAVSNYEVYMLRSVELNETLRNSVISSSGSFPADVEAKIESITLGSLLCAAAICDTNETCAFSQEVKSDVYAQKIFITSTLQDYNPKQLKLFCWLK